MPTNKRRLLTVAAIATLAVGIWSLGGSDDDVETEDARLLTNQIWVNRMPRGERDMIRYFVALRSSHGRIGAAGRTSSWRQFSDLFTWRLERDRIALYFGQERIRWRPQVRAWRCEGSAPEGFELCLRMWDSKHEINLYSRDEWEVDPGNLDATPEGLSPERFQRMGRLGPAPEGAVDESVSAVEPGESFHIFR